jgi:hypothetical protein
MGPCSSTGGGTWYQVRTYRLGTSRYLVGTVLNHTDCIHDWLRTGIFKRVLWWGDERGVSRVSEWVVEWVESVVIHQNKATKLWWISFHWRMIDVSCLTRAIYFDRTTMTTDWLPQRRLFCTTDPCQPLFQLFQSGSRVGFAVYDSGQVICCHIANIEMKSVLINE